MLPENANTIYATVATVILAVLMFLYGILIAHQVLLGTVTALLVILIYLVWRDLQAREDMTNKNHQ